MPPLKSRKVHVTHAYLGRACCSRFQKADGFCGFYSSMPVEGVLDSVIFKSNVYFINKAMKYFYSLTSSRCFAWSGAQGAVAELSG